MTCEACQASTSTAYTTGGLYRFTCLQCCARLVLSAHPSKAQASAMLAAIARCPGSPGRAAILACVRRIREKPR